MSHKQLSPNTDYGDGGSDYGSSGGGGSSVKRSNKRFMEMSDIREHGPELSLSEIKSQLAAYEDTLAKMQAALDKANATIEGLNAKFSEKIEEHKEEISKVKAEMRVLECAAAGDTTAAVAVVSRRTLDDARYYVVAALMIVYESGFPPSLLLDEYDSTHNSIRWAKFNDFLKIFYENHFKVKYDKEKKGNVPQYQTRSVFSQCDQDILVHKRAQFHEKTNVPEREFIPLPFNQFQAKDTVHPYVHTALEDHDDNALLTRLKFFIPGLIWAFTCLKEELIVDDAVLAQYRALVDSNLRVVAGEPEPRIDLQAYLPNRERMELGTGAEIRANKIWKSKLSRMEKSKERAERADRADTVSNTNRRPPPGPAAMYNPNTDGGSESASRATGKRKLEAIEALTFSFPPGHENEGRSSNRQRTARSLERQNDPTQVLTTVMNASGAVERGEKKIREVEAIRAVHHWRFEILRKALVILLDDKLSFFAICNSSPPRRSANSYIHKSVALASLSLIESVTNLPEHLQSSSLPLTAAQTTQYKRDAGKLLKSLYQDGTYFSDRRVDLESDVDDHLKNWVKLERLPPAHIERDVNPDAGVLFLWIQSLKPFN